MFFFNYFELKIKEELRMSLEKQLAEEKAVRKIVEEEMDFVGQDWMKAMDELEAQKAIDQDMTYYIGKTKYWEELAIKTQATLNMRLTDLDKLKEQLKEIEAELFNTKKTTKIHQDLRA
jgi:hypothetical protein